MWWILAALAFAAVPTEPFPRRADALQVRWYGGLDGTGPVRPKWRKQAPSEYQAWTFPDGQAWRVRHYAGKKLLDEKQYDAVGHPTVTITYGEDGLAPAQIALDAWGNATDSLAGWTTVELGGAVLRVPTAPDALGPDRLDWRRDRFTLSLRRLPASGDPWSDGFRDGLRDTCGCILEDRGTAWADGVPGPRYRYHLPDLDGGWRGDVWTFAHDGALYVLAWGHDEGAPPSPEEDPLGYGLGRAIVALWTWKDGK